ncbi:MAG: hypothetical protein ACRDT5_13480 [Mycobacterium sp.]
MTTSRDFRPTVDRAAAEITVAGVPWPLYKLVALAVGFMVLIVVAAATASAAAAVLAAAGTATAVWVGLGALRTSRR